MDEKPIKIILVVVKIIITILAVAGALFVLFPMALILFNQPPVIIVYCAVILFAITLIMFNVNKSVKIAFADPHVLNYQRKTNKELYSFIAWSCGTAFVFAVISMNAAFMYATLIYWIYFIFSMFMFSKVWKFHNKKRRYLFLILILTAAAALFAAPLVRSALLDLLHYFDIY